MRDEKTYNHRPSSSLGHLTARWQRRLKQLAISLPTHLSTSCPSAQGAFCRQGRYRPRYKWRHAQGPSTLPMDADSPLSSCTFLEDLATIHRWVLGLDSQDLVHT